MRSLVARSDIGLIVFLSLALLLGGASAAGHLANLALQWISIGVIAWCLIVPAPPEHKRMGRIAWLFVLAIALILAIQLVPLPPSLWSGLPGRSVIVEGFRLAGMDLPWVPLSMAPARTIASALALLPALAALLLALRLRDPARSLPAVILVFALVSIVVGVAQVAGGYGSPLYLYDITNRSLAVGFFANRNHLATLALVALPCIALLARGEGRGNRRRRSGIGAKLAYAAAAVFILFGLVMSRSDAGLLLALPSFLVGFMIYKNLRISPLVLSGSIALVVAALGGAVALVGQSQSLLSGSSNDFSARSTIYPSTAGLIPDYFPVGSGVGSFLGVYRLQEDPTKITNIYVNHAHSEYLEIALETGLIGILLLAAFLIWWAWKAFGIWNSSSATAKAATAVTGIILIHSAFDYPLRTAAILTIFAAFAAIMAAAAPEREEAASAAP